MNEEWVFYGTPHLNEDLEELRFKVTKAGERFSCAISHIALEGRGQFESEMAPIVNYAQSGGQFFLFRILASRPCFLIFLCALVYEM